MFRIASFFRVALGCQAAYFDFDSSRLNNPSPRGFLQLTGRIESKSNNDSDAFRDVNANGPKMYYEKKLGGPGWDSPSDDGEFA